MIELHGYQQDAVEGVIAAWSGNDQGNLPVVLCAPTGAGKTVIAFALMRQAESLGMRSWMVVHLNTLASQTLERMYDYGLECGLVRAEATHATHRRSLICSVQTLGARDWARLGKWEGCTSECRENCDGRDCNALYAEEFDLKRANLPDLLIIDEAHVGYKYVRRVARAVVANGGQVAGLTATPYSDFMHRQYGQLVKTASTSDLASAGVLVPPRIFHALPLYDLTKSDGSELKPRGSGEEADWTAKQVAAALKAGIVGDMPAIYQEHVRRIYDADAVPSLVSAPTIDIAQRLADAYTDHLGFKFEVVSARDGKDGLPTTNEVLERFDAGHTTGLVSVQKLAIGFDRPGVRCVVLGRPYASLTPLVQMIGRGLRSAAGKADCLVLDHGGNMQRLGPAFDHHYATGPVALEPPRRHEPASADEVFVRECDACGAHIQGSRKRCPECKVDLSKQIELEVQKARMEEYGIGPRVEVDPRLAKYIAKENEDALWYTLSCQARYDIKHNPPRDRYYRRLNYSEWMLSNWAYGQALIKYNYLKRPPDHAACTRGSCRVAVTAPRCFVEPRDWHLHPLSKPERMTGELSLLIEAARNRERSSQALQGTPLNQAANKPKSVRCKSCGEFSAIEFMRNPKAVHGIYTQCRNCRSTRA